MGDIACDSFCFSSLGFSLFLASVLGSCLRCVHRWSARSSSRVTFCASAVPVMLEFGSCCWHSVCSGNHFSGRAILQSTGSSAYCLVRMAGCPLHSASRAAAAPPSSACVDPCGGLWLLLQREQTHLPAGQSVSAGGGTRAKRAVPGVWVGTPVPVDCPCLDERPLFQQSPRQPSQRGRPVPRAKEKSISVFFCFIKTTSTVPGTGVLSLHISK